MRARGLVRQLGSVAMVGVAAMSGCHSDPLSPKVEDVYIEVHVRGGFAGVDYAYAIVGRSQELRGIACSRVCDFEPGDVLVELTRSQVLYFARLLEDAGIHALDGTDFGEQCCDQFYYAVEYREGERESTVRGSTGSLPDDLARAIWETHQLLTGVLPVLIDWSSQPEDWPQDPLVLREYSLESGILSLGLEYGGGCASHEHDLVAWGGWLESFPVQVNVLLTHEDHDDPCDALIYRTLRYDLTRLREEYVQSYPDGGSAPTTIILRLTVPDGMGARQIEYTF